jgi:hypothetical protein
MNRTSAGRFRQRSWARVAVILMATGFVVWALVFIYRTSFIATDGHRYFSLFDDAMVSMRYAWNATHGIGLVWNPGERVEGYTNLLMVGLMALWTGFLDKSGAVLAVQLSGIPVLLGIGALCMLHWQELARGGEAQPNNGLAALAFLGALAYYPLAYWTLTGMETGILTLLMLAGSLLSLTYLRTRQVAKLGSAALLFSLAYLARPDSAPVAVMVLTWAAVFATGGPKQRLRAMALGLGLFAVFPILQTAFRVTYYGSLVPLTYTLKATGMPVGFRIQNGLAFIQPFLREARWAYLLAIAGTIVAFSRRLAVLALPPLVLTVYQIVIGGDAWPYWRLVAPGMPYLILLTLAGVDRVLALCGRELPRLKTQLQSHVGRWLSHAPRWVVRPAALTVIVMLIAAILVLAGIFADYVRPGSPGFGLVQLCLVMGGVLLGLAALGTLRADMVAACAMILLLINLNSRFLTEALFRELPYKAEANRNHVNAALTILQFTTEDASVGVFHAGIIPYYTSRYAVDFLGKNDPYIAGLPVDLEGGPSWYGMSSVPGHNKYDLEYSIHQRLPTYVEGFAWGSQDLTYVFESEYVEVSLPGPDPAFRRGDPAVLWDQIPPDKIIVP